MPSSNSNETKGVLQDPVIDRVKKALKGIEPTEATVRQAINEVQEELSEEIAVETDPNIKTELMRQQNLLVLRGNDIIADLVPSAEMLDD